MENRCSCVLERCNVVSFTRLYFCTVRCGRMRKEIKIKMHWTAIALILGYPIFPLHDVGCNRYKAGFSHRTKNWDRDFSKPSKSC